MSIEEKEPLLQFASDKQNPHCFKCKKTTNISCQNHLQQKNEVDSSPYSDANSQDESRFTITCRK